MPALKGQRQRLDRIRKKELIKASFLNSLADGVDHLTAKAVALPKQRNNPNPEDPVTAPTDFVESSRTVEEVQIFDQNQTNYALIDRMTRVDFTNKEGETLVLVFNNPVVV